MTTVRQVPSDDPMLVALVQAQVAELAERYQENPDHGFAQPPLHVSTIWLLLVGADGRPLGCAAVQPLEHTLPGAAPAAGEVKRLYVQPDARGHGHSRALMNALEEAAADAGYRSLQLETGRRQPEAVAVYRGSGYQQIPPYGHYRASPESICFRKVLPEPAAPLA